MENLNDESLRKLFKESGSRAIDNEPDIWFTRRVVSRLPRRSSIPGRIAWGVFIVVCIVAFGVYVDYVRLFYADTRFAYAYRGFRVSGCRGFRYRVADVPVATSLQVSVFIEKSLLYNCARGFLMEKRTILNPERHRESSSEQILWQILWFQYYCVFLWHFRE